jgi:hypothetical protein
VGDARGAGGLAVAAGRAAPAIVDHHGLAPAPVAAGAAAAASAVGHRAADGCFVAEPDGRSGEDGFGFSELDGAVGENQLGPQIWMGLAVKHVNNL